MEQRRKHDWATIIGSNVVTLLCAVLLFFGTQDTNKTEQLKLAYEQIDKQGKQILELRQMLVATQTEIVNLKAELKENVDRAVLLQDYLDVLPFPAWIKRYDVLKDEFVMVMLNQAYTAEYGITRNQYVGKTDKEVHPEEMANLYRENDLTVMLTGSYVRAEEKVTLPNGKTTDIIVFKFTIMLPDGSMGIGGVSIR